MIPLLYQLSYAAINRFIKEGCKSYLGRKVKKTLRVLNRALPHRFANKKWAQLFNMY